MHKNYGRQGPESETWTPKVAYRRRMARVMHILSPCVRPKRVHKQNIFICRRILLVKEAQSIPRMRTDLRELDSVYANLKTNGRLQSLPA